MASGSGEEKVIPGTQPLQASSFRKGSCILLKGKPCKVVEMTTSKTGKHGHAKVKFVGVDIFTGKKYQELQASTHNMLEVIVTKSDYTCLDVGDDGVLQLLDKENNPGPNLSVNPQDFEYKGGSGDAPIGFQLKQAFENLPDGQELTVSVTNALGESAVQAFKTVAAPK